MTSDIIYNLIMGLLQGLTEWLPVSSSGHLVLAQHLFGVEERTLFDAILHLGTLFAAIVYFRKDLKPLVNLKNPMTHKIIIASIPIIIVGLLLSDVIEAVFALAIIASVLLIINGCMLMVNAFLKEEKAEKGNEGNKLTMKLAIIIGVFQIFALFPGISRSGTTITTGRALGINWALAAKFSFFISFIPLAGAAGFKIITGYQEFNALYILGFIVAFLVGYATIDIMMGVLRRGKFHYFGFYTIGLGVVMLVVLIFT
ncbi:undecaprenyl-diphosphate phosphatase [[Eubacterium] cellulosolvens]